MNFLKGLAVSLLSLFLFLSLAIFGTAFMLKQTILNPGFAASQVENLDLTSLARESVTQMLPTEFSDREFVNKAIENTITDIEPWVKEKASKAIYDGYDYLLGESQSLRITISLTEFKTILKDNLWQALLEYPPPEIQGLPPAMVEQQFNQFYNQFATEIPSSFEVDESMLDPELLTQLELAREIISYFQLAFWGLLFFMVLLILGIFLIQRNLRTSSRGLGITFLLYGIFEYLSVFLMKTLLLPQMPLPQMPVPGLESWIMQLISDLISPLEIFAIGVGVFGLVLIIVSFFLPKPAEEPD